MDTNMENTPKIKRESKNKIRVEFERTPLLERLKARFVSFYFLTNVIWYIFRLILMIGIAYVVLFPFISKIAASFMPIEDFTDVTVRLIPKNPTLKIYSAIITDLGFFKAMFNTFLLSFSTAVIQTLICCLIGYGFAKFKFRGNKVLFALVILTMIIPPQTLRFGYFMTFRYFDLFKVMTFLTGRLTVGISWIDSLLGKIHILKMSDAGFNFINTPIPFFILSLTGLAFKNGLYIFLLRQFYRGIPDELEESAYLDGAGTFRTFVQIILPLSVSMMITVFLFSFSWQWTDTFYTKLFYTSQTPNILTEVVTKVPKTLQLIINENTGGGMYETAARNTAGIMMIIPLVILYLFCQRQLVQGIERSGISAA